MEAGSVNFGGTIICSSSIDFGNPSCECFKSSADLWIIDSGASNHITFNKASLTNIQTMSYPMLVSLPNGYKVKVIEFGDVMITSGIVLHNVLYVPSFKYNLVSVHSLTLSMRSVILFTSVSCLLQAPSVKRPQVLGNSREGLYFLCSRCLKNPASFTTCCCMSHNNQNSSLSSNNGQATNKTLHDNNKCNSHTVCSSTSDAISAEHCVDLLWHNRLGHVPL